MLTSYSSPVLAGPHNDAFNERPECADKFKIEQGILHNENIGQSLYVRLIGSPRCAASSVTLCLVAIVM